MKRFYIFVGMALLTLTLFAEPSAADDRSDPRAITLWWVVFNNPADCITNPGAAVQCGSADVFGPSFLETVANGAPDPSLIAPNIDAGLAVLYATGGITDRRGRITLAASIYKTAAEAPLSLAAAPTIVDPLGLGNGLANPDAEIHLVLRDHGARVKGGELEQISSFLDPYCSDPNLLYFSGPNLCTDAQFAVFGEGQQGAATVFASGSTPTAVRRAAAVLVRNGDAVQAIVRTTLAND